MVFFLVLAKGLPIYTGWNGAIISTKIFDKIIDLLLEAMRFKSFKELRDDVWIVDLIKRSPHSIAIRGTGLVIKDGLKLHLQFRFLCLHSLLGLHVPFLLWICSTLIEAFG